jgi:formylglycine-generating enzyme required for sulfatase activity
VKRIAIVVFALSTLFVGRSALRAPGFGIPPVWTDPITGMTFVLVRARTFQMGSPVSEKGREAQEVPHTVRLTRSFYLGRHEVTQAQWTAVMGTNPSHFRGCDACPVERVSLHDVEAFIARLSERAGPGFRLPTEAEWEAGCRAGGDEPFGRTAALGSLDANIDGTYPYEAPAGIARGKTTPVGLFPPNALGLFDMQGNVWEWTSDWYCLYPDGPTTDQRGACSSEYRVIRGGSWAFDGNSARCALRYTHRPQDSGFSLGFRVAKGVE